MRAKLRQIKHEIHMRMHDPVSQTGRWLQTVVRGYFNYYAVPGNLDSLTAFRERLGWRTLRCRSQQQLPGRADDRECENPLW